MPQTPIPDLTPHQMVVFREALGWSVNKVAAKTGIAAEDVDAIERGERTGTSVECQRISNVLRLALGATVDDRKDR